MGFTKGGVSLKQPTFVSEFAFVSTNLLLVKLYSEETFTAMSFFAVMLPPMIYMIGTLFGNLLKFIKLMHMEDCDDESTILTVKQRKILTKVVRNLLAYFGLYFLSQQLDKVVKP